MIDVAKTYATYAHAGQVDLAGEPYIQHIETVVNTVKQMTNDEDTIVIAYLHDILEDTSITAENLLNDGFSVNVVSAVQSLSRKKGYPYKQYIQELSNPRAIIVKIADLLHNLDDERLPKEKRSIGRKKKYESALDILLAKISL